MRYSPSLSPSEEQASCQRALAYLRGKQSPEGGFCFYRTAGVEEPNLADTYHAVRTFRLLETAPPHQDQIITLARFSMNRPHPSDQYYSAFILQSLTDGQEFPAAWCQHIATWDLPVVPPAGSSRISGWLNRTRQLVALKRQFTEFRDAPAVLQGLCSLEHPTGGFGTRPNLLDTWLAVEILHLCDAALSLEATAAFVARLQSLPNGFSAVSEGMLASVEVLYARLRCCHLLGRPVQHPEAIRSFVLASQGRHGGFAPACGALPGIEMTHRAVRSLHYLDEPAPYPKEN